MPCVGCASPLNLHQGSRAGAVIDRSGFRGESEWGSGGTEVAPGMRRSVGGCLPGLCKRNIKMYYPSKWLLTGTPRKHLPSIESRLQKMQLKSAKSTTKVELWLGFPTGRLWLARLVWGWQVLVWMWLWTSCPLPGPWVLPQARTYARGRAGIFTSCPTWGFS